MAHPPDNTDPMSWHHYFAIENNNRAWNLAAKAGRSADEAMEMLNAAHASALHWSVVGNELNRMRARMLLAEVHALVGFGTSALALADQVRHYFLNRETDDWEIAFVHTIHAHGAAASGASDLHMDSYEAAQSAIDAIADEEDRRIVMQTFEQVPAPV
jgi:hypothetical protein